MIVVGVKDKRPEPEKNGEGAEVTSRLNEEVPVSAVALKMKEKVGTDILCNTFNSIQYC